MSHARDQLARQRTNFVVEISGKEAEIEALNQEVNSFKVRGDTNIEEEVFQTDRRGATAQRRRRYSLGSSSDILPAARHQARAGYPNIFDSIITSAILQGWALGWALAFVIESYQWCRANCARFIIYTGLLFKIGFR